MRGYFRSEFNIPSPQPSPGGRGRFASTFILSGTLSQTSDFPVFRLSRSARPPEVYAGADSPYHTHP